MKLLGAMQLSYCDSVLREKVGTEKYKKLIFWKITCFRTSMKLQHIVFY